MTDEIKRAAEEVIKNAVKEQRIMLETGGYGGSNALILHHLTIDVLPRLLSEALLAERRKAYEDSIEVVNNEPELTDEMPDEMWETIKNDRALYSEVLRAVVVSTKRNIANEIRRRMEGV